MTTYIQEVSSPGKMLRNVKKMNKFGPRLTGNEAHNEFIDYLKSKIEKMGIRTYSDPYFFDSWYEKASSLVLHENGIDKEIHVSSAFPYSGETPPEGVCGELEFVAEKHVGFIVAKDKIAVVNVEELDFLPSEIAFDKRRALPETTDIPAKYNGPVATAFVNFPFLAVAKAAGAKAVICIWRGMSDACIEGQYLPFILSYQGIPAVWVNSSDGDKVIEAAKNKASATLTLDAEKKSGTITETFYSILPGKNSREAIIINTHTDGTNCIEENGAIALLDMMKYYKDKELDRTLIFVFVTGHFRLPSFKNPLGGGVQATSKWLAYHRDLWDGKNGHIKAVAGVSVEHMGCRRWKDTEDGYKEVGDIEIEMVYTGNPKMDEIYFDSLNGRERVNTITFRGHNFLHFGEGQPLFNCGIPEIALVTAPDCLCVISENNEMDKFDARLMFEQTDTFIKIVNTLLPMSKEDIGTCDGYSFLTKNARIVGNLFTHKN